jgi:hypothetical protein
MSSPRERISIYADELKNLEWDADSVVSELLQSRAESAARAEPYVGRKEGISEVV